MFNKAQVFDNDNKSQKRIYIFNILLLIILFIGIILLFLNYRINKNQLYQQNLTEGFFSILSNDNVSDISLNKLFHSKNSLSELSGLKLAHFYIQDGKFKEALEIYEKIINSTKNQIVLELSELGKVSLILNNKDLQYAYKSFLDDFLSFNLLDSVFFNKREIYKAIILIYREDYNNAKSILEALKNNHKIIGVDLDVVNMLLNYIISNSN